MTNKTSLPLDILEEIIDALAIIGSGSRRSSSITPFSLVCHATLPLCRKHIFGSITINTHCGKTRRTISSLSQMLTESPELAFYIRTLIFHLIPSDVRRGPKVLMMSQKLTRLRSLELRFSNGETLHWAHYRQIFLPLLHLPTIIRLKLHGIAKFFLSDIMHCLGLERLEIEYSTCSTRGNNNPLAIPPGLRPTSVEKFKVVGGVLDLRSFKELLSNCHHLTDIHIDFLDELSKLGGLFNIVQGSLKTFKHLTVESRIDHRPEDLPDPFSGLCQELELMSGRNVLETLRIGITVSLDCRYTRGDEWRALGNVLLADGSTFPALRRVSLTFTVCHWVRDRPDGTLKPALSGYLQELASCPTVDFELQVDFRAT